MNPILRVLCLLGVSLLLAAAAAPARAGAFVDLVDFPSQEANWDRFYALQDRLFADFDEICPDTYCEGEYSNLIALQFRCSVHAASGTLQGCVLVVGGGNLEVDPADGALLSDNRTWACAAPLAAQTPVDLFHAALAGSRPLLAPLPGSGLSLHETVSDCLH